MLTEGMYIADRYEILGKVGAGGMSDVYKAKDLTLGRFVAIKVLKAEFSEDINFVTKFRSEAQAAAGLEHPNIVNIYDVGSENGLHYIVMEYVEGITLKTYIEKKGQLSFKEAVSIAIQVVTIGRFYPSSQLCSVCGAQWLGTKDLAVREWTCPVCGAIHDRDINAAKNILNGGLLLID